MGKLSSLLYGAVLGAGLMYFLDPQQGNRRKAMIRDHVYQMRSDARNGLDIAVQDLRNRARGVLAEGMAMVSNEVVPDQVVEQRVRSRLGYLSRHPGAIQVSVQNGTAVLDGDILTEEAEALPMAIRKVRGVQDVRNNLRLHETAGNIPHLQGEGWMPGQGSGQWTPGARLLAGIGAGYLFLYGMRGGFFGPLAQIGGLLLGTRALTNKSLQRVVGVGSDEEAVSVRKSININAPVEEVYSLWSNFENFPRFMSNIENIKDMGNGRSHWVVKGPAGSKVEFDAIMTENKPNEVVSWKTTEDSTVKHHGQVRFRQGAKEGTQVNVNMAYTPPAGVVGHAVASIFGKDPKTEMDQDLGRMKSLLEQGKTSAGPGQGHVSREEMVGGRETRGGGTSSTGRSSRSGGSIPNTGDKQDTEEFDGDAQDYQGSGDVNTTGSIPNTGGRQDFGETSDLNNTDTGDMKLLDDGENDEDRPLLAP